MSGLTSLLNIAKVGLLAHQTNLQTIGHNISNVNTEGYSKQKVTLTAKPPTPTFIGPIGNGVDATEIKRAYDRFITMSLFAKTSDLSGLETRLSGLKTIESLMNEVDENGLNNLLADFWQGWDDLANNAEGMTERRTLLQRANLLAQSLKDKYQSLMKLSRDIDLNIQSNIDDINRLAKQIAELNVQIVSAEASHHSANDLRDQRDELVKELSKLTNIKYFETDRGSYTILIGQGSPLVEDDKAWELGLLDNKVTWFGSNGQTFELTTKDITSGELGGWLDIKRKLKPKDPTELTNSVVNTSNGGEAIHMDDLFSDIDGVIVSGNFTISFSGIDQDGNAVSDTFNGNASSTIRDFANFVANAFGNKVQITTTDDGRIKIKDIDPGTYPISFQIDGINGDIIGLKLGKFDNNYPLSFTEKLNLIAKELIKTVNAQHAQGAGLIPLQEVTSFNEVLNPDKPLISKSSGLEFSGDVKEGSFKIWLYDKDGNVIDTNTSTPGINDPITINVDLNTDLNSLASQIDNIDGLTATVINGKTLVIGVDGTPNNGKIVEGFAFSDDTSNVLMALGLNSFFTGTTANDIALNPDLINDPRLIAAAKVGTGKVDSITSTYDVMEPKRKFGEKIYDGNLIVSLKDSSGLTVNDRDGNPISKTININRAQTSINDILDEINSLEGIKATIEDGLIKIQAENESYQVSLEEDPANSPPTNFLKFLGNLTDDFLGQSFEASLRVDRTFEPVKTYDAKRDNLDVVFGNITIRTYDSNGQPISDLTINVDPDNDSLEDIRDAINNTDYLRAVIKNNKLQIFAAGDAAYFSFINDDSNLLNYLGLSIPPAGELSPANNENAIAIRNLNTEPISDLGDATISDSYHGLVGEIGINTRSVELDHDFMKGAVRDLFARRENISGVSLDEELSDLLKFQHAYTAAAKLIKAADELFLSLLQVK